MNTDPRRDLPSVEHVRAALGDDSLPHPLVADAARRAVDAARAEVSAGRPVDHAAVVAVARGELDAARTALLTPVVNATGVLLHTNLGRAPLGERALAAMQAVAGASNLEYRLDSGRRGSRHDHAGGLLARACGAEAGLVVNNNAGAVMLVLAALARDRSVVVSRGELVEIGGGFRVPEIMAETRARLVEVGTTNRTRRADYERALGEDPALLLKVHASNYRMIGFTEQASVRDLATLGPPVFVDAGSGLLDEQTPWLAARPPWLHDEPGVRQCIDGGAAVVTFSGDKLLGGPQAGVIVGRRDLVAAIARHPLARALRADKLTLAALQSIALDYLDGIAGSTVPLWAMATASVDELRTRARSIAAVVPGAAELATEAAAGGGSLPGLTIPSVGVAVQVADVDAALAQARTAHHVVALGRDGRVVADLRSVDPRDDERVANTLREVAST